MLKSLGMGMKEHTGALGHRTSLKGEVGSEALSLTRGSGVLAGGRGGWVEEGERQKQREKRENFVDSTLLEQDPVDHQLR